MTEPSWTVLKGDCRQVLAGLEAASVDAVVTDPPYGLEFMGVAWDTFADRPAGTPRTRNTWGDFGSREHPRTADEAGRIRADKARAQQAFHATWVAEALRVLKPGGHLLAFGGTRTYHRLVCALEDAGFEIRDCVAWLYGSGFPKSLDVSKAIDRAAGAEREVIGSQTKARSADGASALPTLGSPTEYRTWDVTAPATPDARRWAGWGTALKPAFEPIVLARRPLGARNVAENVLAYGTGGLHVDACRLPFHGPADAAAAAAVATGRRGGGDQNAGRHAYGRFESGPASLEPYLEGLDRGRWPPNVALDTDAAAMLDAQVGESVSTGGDGSGFGTRNIYQPTGRIVRDGPYGLGYGDAGGASRFMYVAKADRAERNVGLEGGGLWGGDEVAERALLWSSGEQSPGTFQADGTHRAARNHHPTVKPVALMRWLCRLITPPGGLVLDPFAGSGSTGIAAVAEGFRFLGIERDPEYCRIARARIAAGAPLLAAAGEDPEPELAGQLTLDLEAAP